jgi:hypothetical protein
MLGGLDVHWKQLTSDHVDNDGLVRQGRIVTVTRTRQLADTTLAMAAAEPHRVAT